MNNIDDDIMKILKLAGLLDMITPELLALADRMYIIHTRDNTTNHQRAAMDLIRIYHARNP